MSNENDKILWTKHKTPELTVQMSHQLTNCTKCGRKLLVEMTYCGVPHNSRPIVTCGECIDIPQEFLTEFPNIAREIEEWKNS